MIFRTFLINRPEKTELHWVFQHLFINMGKLRSFSQVCVRIGSLWGNFYDEFVLNLGHWTNWHAHILTSRDGEREERECEMQQIIHADSCHHRRRRCTQTISYLIKYFVKSSWGSDNWALEKKIMRGAKDVGHTRKNRKAQLFLASTSFSRDERKFSEIKKNWNLWFSSDSLNPKDVEGKKSCLKWKSVISMGKHLFCVRLDLD